MVALVEAKKALYRSHPHYAADNAFVLRFFAYFTAIIIRRAVVPAFLLMKLKSVSLSVKIFIRFHSIHFRSCLIAIAEYQASESRNASVQLGARIVCSVLVVLNVRLFEIGCLRSL